MSWKGRINEEPLTTEAIQETRQRDISFREKDLQFLIKQCQQQFKMLIDLKQQKEEIYEFCKTHGLNPHEHLMGKEGHKYKGENKSKKSFKCSIKSCGKVMGSEAQLLTHMKRHGDKRSHL